MLISSTQNFGLDRLKMLIYGSAGVGKTSLAATIKEPTIIISAEAGLLSIQGTEIDVIDITTNDSGQVLPKEQRYDRLIEVYKYLNTPEAQEKYSWVMLDSLSEIAQNVLEKYQKQFPERSKALPMWGEYSKTMRSLIKSFRDLPGYNVVFTALSERDKDESNNFTNTISMPGNKVAQSLPGYFDLVMYYYVGRDKDGSEVRTLLTQPTETTVAKDRSGKLEKLEQPDLLDIINKIRAK